jgi:hypothetical protein
MAEHDEGSAPLAERLAIQVILGVGCWQERVFGWVPQCSVYPIEDSLQGHDILEVRVQVFSVV